MRISIAANLLLGMAALGLGAARPSAAQATDASRSAAALQAEANYLRARLDRVEAELAFAGYIEETGGEELKKAQARVNLASIEWSRITRDLGYIRRGLLPAHTEMQANQDKAGLELKEAKANLDTIRKTTRENAPPAIRDRVVSARTEEAKQLTAYRPYDSKPVD